MLTTTSNVRRKLKRAAIDAAAVVVCFSLCFRVISSVFCAVQNNSFADMLVVLHVRGPRVEAAAVSSNVLVVVGHVVCFAVVVLIAVIVLLQSQS